MIELADIETLAELSRLELAEDEKVGLQKDLGNILAYVEELKKAKPAESALAGGWEDGDTALVRNVMRPDTDAYKPATFTDDLLAAAPETKDGYVVVKKIL